jgi:uncharacterized peroxidase-related enzyme
LTGDNDLVVQLEKDYRQAKLTVADRAMLDYSAKLTRTPTEMSESDIEGLGQAGFDERAILDIAQVVAYFAYVNRIADGLGVKLEDYWAKGLEDYE